MYNIQHNDFVASHALEHTVYGCTLLTYLPCFSYVLGTWLCLYISVSKNKGSETLYKVSYIGSEYDKHCFRADDSTIKEREVSGFLKDSKKLLQILWWSHGKEVYEIVCTSNIRVCAREHYDGIESNSLDLLLLPRLITENITSLVTAMK